MLRIAGRTWGITVLIGLLGALLGYGLDLVLQTQGWGSIVASMGLCAGAAFAGALATPEPPPVHPAEAALIADAAPAEAALIADAAPTDARRAPTE